MKRILSIALAMFCSLSFAAYPTSVNTTTSPYPGIIWVAVSPYANSDLTQGYMKISVSINGVKVIASYAKQKSNATAPFLIGFPYYGSTAAPVSVVSESTSLIFANQKAGIISVSQGVQPYFSTPTLLLCGKTFTAC